MDGEKDCDGLDSEEFLDEFQCCVCLDIMYKPVVLACGHILCFWCVFRAMDTFRVSRCPVCRNPYNHFPSVCQLLHFLLLKLYPSAYRRREIQVAEEEKKCGYASPHFDDTVLNFDSHKVIHFQDSSCPPLLRASVNMSNATCEGDDSLTQNCTVEHKDRDETLKLVPLSWLECSVCKKLLYRLVVLNCGHVYCEACINNPHDDICRCPGCQCDHPNGFPNVCLVLNNFLEKHFPEECFSRQESQAKFQHCCPSGSLKDNQEHVGKNPKESASKHSKLPTDVYLSWLSNPPGHGPKVHPGVGCDYCGMCPIIGQRYKCKDCVEKIGFDLCEGCYNSSSKLPGRFNQQHTEEHQFIVVEPHYLRYLIPSFGEEYDEDYAIFLSNQDNLQVVVSMLGDSSSASDYEAGTAASHDLTDDGLHELQDAAAPADALDNLENGDSEDET